MLSTKGCFRMHSHFFFVAYWHFLSFLCILLSGVVHKLSTIRLINEIMDYFIPIFFLFNHCLFFGFTSGNAPMEDDALVELAKGPDYFNKFCADKGLIINEKNQFVSDKYEAHLGLLYLMRTERDYYMLKMKIEDKEINIKELENAFILYEYMFWQYVAEYVKAIDPALAEQIPTVKWPIKLTFESNGTQIIITLCEAIKNWAYIRNRIRHDDNSYNNVKLIDLTNKQTLIDEYAVKFYNCYAKDLLFDMHKLKLKLNANSKFDNSFARLRNMFDFNMEKLKTMAQKKAFLGSLTSHIVHTPFYEIDKAIEDSIFLILLKEICSEKVGAKMETAPLSANAKSFIQTKKSLIREYFKVIYLMRLKWQCAQIENYQKECIKFQKYFNFLYEYLFREYNEVDNADMPQQFAAVRPNFKLGSAKVIMSLTDVINQLAIIGAFFFDPTFAKEFDYKLYNFFKKFWKPKLLNKLKVRGEKTIGQKLFESVAKIGKSKKKVQEKKAAAAVLAEKQQLTINLSRENFDNFLRENFEKLQSENDYETARQIYKWLYLPTNKKANDVPMLQVPKAKMTLLQVPKLKVSKAQFNDGTAIISLPDDDLFLAFVVNNANFEHHCIEMECQNLLARVGLLSKRKGKGKYDIGETVRYLKQQYEAYFGVVYLLKKKWNCDKMDEYLMFGECKKFKEYFHVLYEFLFKKYLEVNCPSFQFAIPVQPIFQLGHSKTKATIIDVLDNLCIIWAFFFDHEYGQKYGNKLEKLFKQKAAAEPKLLNEETIGQIIVKDFQQITNFGTDFKQIFGREKSEEIDVKFKQSLIIDEATNEHSSKDNTDKAIQYFREAFDGIIKSMAETTKTMDDSVEGFGKTKKLLRYLFL